MVSKFQVRGQALSMWKGMLAMASWRPTLTFRSNPSSRRQSLRAFASCDFYDSIMLFLRFYKDNYIAC